MPDEVVIASGVRMSVGKFGRGFREVPAQRLGAIVIREAAIYAGVPPETGSFTVNKVCGMENMSRAPHLVRNLRWGVKFGDASIQTPCFMMAYGKCIMITIWELQERGQPVKNSM